MGLVADNCIVIEKPVISDKDKRQEVIAERFVDYIKSDEKFFALLLTLYEDKELNKRELFEKLNIGEKEKKELIGYLSFLTKKAFVESELKSKSIRQNYFSLTRRTKRILNDVYGINDLNVKRWTNAYHSGKLMKKLETIMFL